MSLATTDYSIGAAIQPLPISPLQINGAVFTDGKVLAMQIESVVGQHDVLNLGVLMPILDSSTLLGSPLYLRYGLSPNYGYFYGYVSNVSKPQTADAVSQLQVTALGFSSVMKASPSRIFADRTTPQILGDVVQGPPDVPYRIGLAPLEHNFAHHRLAQTSETDWEFAVRVAGMAGFYIYPYSGAVVMSHPIRALDSGAPTRVLEKSSQVLDDQPLIDFIPNQRTDTVLDDFEPEFAYFTADGRLQTHIPDVAPQRRMKIPDYIYSQAYGDFIADGMHVMTGMYQTADARIKGDAGVRPGDLVSISTGMTAAATDNFDGLWYTTYVSTFIDTQVYQTALKLCRDTYRSASTVGTIKTFYGSNAQNFPTMRLGSDGAWVSSWSS